MTDFKKLRDGYMDAYGSSTPGNKATLALLDRAIAEDADGVDVSTASVDKKTRYMKAVAMGQTADGKYVPVVVDGEGYVIPSAAKFQHSYIDNLKAEVAALTRQLADEKAKVDNEKERVDYYRDQSRKYETAAGEWKVKYDKATDKATEKAGRVAREAARRAWISGHHRAQKPTSADMDADIKSSVSEAFIFA